MRAKVGDSALLTADERDYKPGIDQPLVLVLTTLLMVEPASDILVAGAVQADGGGGHGLVSSWG